MSYFEIIILGIIQGLTEFLPISSSGHLILAPALLGFEDQGLALDAILHLGTLFAIIIFFRDDLSKLVRGLFDRASDPDYHRLAWHIVWASFPAGLIGLFFGDVIEHELRSPIFVAWNLLFWSMVLLAADRYAAKQESPIEDVRRMSLGQVLFIGYAQAIALLPGTSRSGITIAGGLFTHLSPTTAARFSFLLGAPIILAAGAHKMVYFMSDPAANSLQLSWPQLGVGLLVSFVVGYFSIKLLLGIVSRLGLLPFIVYRILLGVFILNYF
ncbi:MAG: undecaprenyl-diphosphate phosphatase [Nitrospinae bacterium]|nr:undecaprenyl-diphosphate phosphatase [Nitrospinota bacterium]